MQKKSISSFLEKIRIFWEKKIFFFADRCRMSRIIDLENRLFANKKIIWEPSIYLFSTRNISDWETYFQKANRFLILHLKLSITWHSSLSAAWSSCVASRRVASRRVEAGCIGPGQVGSEDSKTKTNLSFWHPIWRYYFSWLKISSVCLCVCVTRFGRD